ncbi:MAG: hypothetical protein FIA93_08250 [Deltaproteobacteria bacterium]|nr:hypothetical protein [Deltaproteobacteria bacterium]
MNRYRAMVSMATLAVALASAPCAQAAVSWSEIQLVDASGVPNEPLHAYYFKGILTLWHQKSSSSTSLDVSVPPVKSVSTTEGVVDATIWVEGKGKWNAKTNEAEESLVFDGDAAGKFASRLKCTGDPWISPATCVVLSAQYAVSKGKNWDFPGIVKKGRKPLSQPAVTLAEAESLSSKQKSSAAPPPPPPPKADKKLSSPKKEGPPVASAPGAVAAMKSGAAAPAAKPPVPQAAVNLAEISSNPDLAVGTKPVQWGGIVTVNASEARRVHDGVCEFAVRHTARNAGPAAAGAFGRRWTNSNGSGAWERSYPPIPANGTVERIDTLPLKPGRNVLSLTLDPGNAVAESNENNNQYRFSGDVTGVCGAAAAPGAPVSPGGRLKMPKP